MIVSCCHSKCKYRLKWFQKSLIFNFLFPNPTDELRYLIRNYKGNDEESKLSFGSWNHFIFMFIAAYSKLVIFWPKQYCSTAVLESLAKLNFLYVVISIVSWIELHMVLNHNPFFCMLHGNFLFQSQRLS